MLGAGKRVAGLVAQVVHARQELAIQNKRQVAAHARERQLLRVVGLKCAVRAEKRHFGGQKRFDALAELLLEVLLVQAQLIQVQQEVVARQIALRHDAFTHDGHVPGLDGLVVLLQAERIHIQRAVEVRDRAAADAGVFVVGYLQFFGIQVRVVAAIVV